MRWIFVAAEEMVVRLGFFIFFGFLAFASAWWGLHLFHKVEYPPIRQVNAIITGCHEDNWVTTTAWKDVSYSITPIRVCNGRWAVQGHSYYGELANNSYNGKLAPTDTEGKRVTISVLVSDPGHVVDPDHRDQIIGDHNTEKTLLDEIPRPVYGVFLIALGMCSALASLTSLSPGSYVSARRDGGA